MKFKIGENIVCHTDCIIVSSFSKWKSTTAGKKYKTYYDKRYNNNFFIFDDNNERHYFDFEGYNKWFYCERLAKLKKLNECQN